MTSSVTAYLGLGGNQGNSKDILSGAIEDLRRTDGTRCSSFYRTAPLGYEQQGDFLNAVCEIETSLSPGDLLNRLQTIETKAGRDRNGPRWGPRTLDIDLLLYGDWRQESTELTLPHPRMHQRAFVLYPLMEIAPGLLVPDRGTVEDLAKACAEQTINRLD